METDTQKIKLLGEAINNLCLTLDGIDIAETEWQKEIAARGMMEARKEAIDLLDRFHIFPYSSFIFTFLR